MTTTNETAVNESTEVWPPKGYWEAANGNLVPDSKVSDLEKARDRVVRELIAVATPLGEDLLKFKQLALSEVAQFIDMSAAQYNTTMRGAAGKGNVTLTTFDGRYKVERRVADRVAFDERLQVAKAKIDEFIRSELKGSKDSIKVIVNDTFKVDREGRVSVAKVLNLRSHAIDHPLWKEAMAAITDSMRAVGTATYLRFYKRNDDSGHYVPIPLHQVAL